MRFNLSCVKYPRLELSGDQNAVTTPSVPGNGRLENASSGRTQSCVALSTLANEGYTPPIGRKHCTTFHSVEDIRSILRWRDREANHVCFGRLPVVEVRKRENRSNEGQACYESPGEPIPTRPRRLLRCRRSPP